MAKLQDWLDEFVKNNYPANDVTEWPEQYGTGGDTPEVPVDEYFTKTKIELVKTRTNAIITPKTAITLAITKIILLSPVCFVISLSIISVNGVLPSSS